MKTIKLDDESYKNLIVFLDRVTVKGITENMAFILLYEQLNKAESEGE